MEEYGLGNCYDPFCKTCHPDLDGTSGQDRESYSDTQDRDDYTVSPELEEGE